MENNEIQWKAVAYGLITFICVWVLWAVFSNMLVNSAETPNEAIFHATSIISGLLPGYIASLVSGKQFLVHSFITGAVLTIGILVFWALVGALSQSSIFSLIMTPIFLITLSVLGGFIAKLQGKTI